MGLIQDWIVLIVSATLLVVVLKMILPLGKMNGFCNDVLNLFYIYIVISPILNLLIKYV